MDSPNARCHNNIETEIYSRGQEDYSMKRLTSYSCDLSPIENIFHSEIKSKARELLDENIFEMMENESQMAFRHQKLESVVNGSLQTVTSQKVRNTFRRIVAKVIPKAFWLEEL